MFGQNVNNDFYSTLNKTICNLTECEGHTMLEYTMLEYIARQDSRLFADRDKRYAHGSHKYGNNNIYNNTKQ